MDLNVSVPAVSELFEDNDTVYPVSMGRENLKILASPGSESSGVSSLDAEEAKKLASGSSPIMVSEPSSAVQTEGESSDGGSDGDDDKPTEQSQTEENVQTGVEIEQPNSDAVNKTAIDGKVADDNVITDNNGNESNADNDDELIEMNVGNVDNQSEQVATEPVEQVKTRPIYRMPTYEEYRLKYDNVKIMYEGRDILDFTPNIINPSWNIQYAVLPDKSYSMYISNRSQYNRLAPGYERPTNYTLHLCLRCGFCFPVMNSDIIGKAAEAAQAAYAAHVAQHAFMNLNDMGAQNVPSYVSNCDSPIQNVNSLVQNMNAQSMPSSSMHTNNGQMNNLMFNNNGGVNAAAAAANQNYAYQNRNQFGNMNGTAAASIAVNNQNGYKQNGNNNGYYGNNNMMVNSLANQIGNNNYMNGTTNNTSNQLNQQHQLNNAALANLMHTGRPVSNYGFNRNPQQNMNNNKSGINYNNSHKPMPTYSHF